MFLSSYEGKCGIVQIEPAAVLWQNYRRFIFMIFSYVVEYYLLNKNVIVLVFKIKSVDVGKWPMPYSIIALRKTCVFNEKNCATNIVFHNFTVNFNKNIVTFE